MPKKSYNLAGGPTLTPAQLDSYNELIDAGEGRILRHRHQ
jgi:hypothetical protein